MSINFSKRTTRRFESLRKNRCFILLVFLIVVYLVNLYAMTFTYGKTIIENRKGPPVKLSNVVVHIDLKGTPLKLEYLKKLLPMLKTHGVTGFLMEYEDMFPYEGKLVNLSAENRYEKPELEEFLTLAVDTGFEIIPLVQTFGHMEFALKLREFQHLREDPFYPDSICPSNIQSLELIRDMLGQVIRFHRKFGLKHLHIGCDEVKFINKCKRCYNRRLKTLNIFISHLEIIAGFVENISPETTVLIWDDMLRSVKPDKWEEMDYLGNIVPVYWDYKPDLSLTHYPLLQYHKKFGDIWIASAFKGADGDVSILPVLRDRFLNHFMWMTTISGYKFGGERDTHDFKGIILTGWSRYTHMDPPCDLLPVSIPSLILNLLLIDVFKKGAYDKDIGGDWVNFYEEYVEPKLINEFRCNRPIDLEGGGDFRCQFDGSKLYYKLKHFLDRNDEIMTVFNNQKFGTSSKMYHAKLGSFNLLNLQRTIMWCKQTLAEISDIEDQLKEAMAPYYKDNFIKEYVESKTYYAKRTILSILTDLKDFLKFQSWPRGPLKNTVYFHVKDDNRKSTNPVQIALKTDILN